ncbi:unnamed protein product [Sympodiomycopsis kandeliae]
MGSLKQRQQQGAGSSENNPDASHYDPLSVLDENGAAEPLDDAEQRQVIANLTESNKENAKFYRYCSLFLLVLNFVVYLVPIPSYLMGTHSETHHSFYFAKHDVQGTHEDLFHLPAAPIYFLLVSGQCLILYAAGKEIADLAGLIKGVAGVSFPMQPHRFGTAPKWLLPTLEDLRFASSGAQGNLHKRADKEDQVKKNEPEKPSLSTTQPRLIYLMLLAFATLPMPLLTFGTGNFVNSAWWGVEALVMGIVCLIEYSIGQNEREIHGLDGKRYSYKGA